MATYLQGCAGSVGGVRAQNSKLRIMRYGVTVLADSANAVSVLC